MAENQKFNYSKIATLRNKFNKKISTIWNTVNASPRNIN